MSSQDTNLPAPKSESAGKTTVGLRYLGTYASGAFTLLIAVGSFSPDQQNQILSSVHTMYTATHDFVGAAASIWYIVFPILAIWLGKMGVDSSGFKAMMDRIFAAAQSGNRDAAITIIRAAAAPQIGTKAIINPALSTADTPPTVAASVSDLSPQVRSDIR